MEILIKENFSTIPDDSIFVQKKNMFLFKIERKSILNHWRQFHYVNSYEMFQKWATFEHVEIIFINLFVTFSISVSWNKSNHVPSTNSRILGTKYWLLLIFFREIDVRFLKVELNKCSKWRGCLISCQERKWCIIHDIHKFHSKRIIKFDPKTKFIITENIARWPIRSSK